MLNLMDFKECCKVRNEPTSYRSIGALGPGISKKGAILRHFNNKGLLVAHTLSSRVWRMEYIFLYLIFFIGCVILSVEEVRRVWEEAARGTTWDTELQVWLQDESRAARSIRVCIQLRTHARARAAQLHPVTSDSSSPTWSAGMRHV